MKKVLQPWGLIRLCKWKSDNGLPSPLTESMDTVEYIDEQRRLWSARTDAHVDLDFFVCIWHVDTLYRYMSRNMRKRTFWHERQTKIQICAVSSVFVVRMKKRCILCYQKCVKWRVWSDCANAQSDLNLPWAHMSDGTFPDDAAQILY